MFKRFVFLFLVILILFTPACGEKQVINAMTAQEMVEYIDKRIDEKNSTQTVEWASATVISVGAGNATCHLGTDPIGTNVIISNPREIPLEIDDEVSILKFGSLSNAIIDFRKDISLNNIYVDYLVGFDSYGKDSNGNQYGTINAPFKTLQYTVNRLPKNLNGRIIRIYFNTLTTEDLIIDNFYGGGSIYIYPVTGTSVVNINSLIINSCHGAFIEIGYLGLTGYSNNNGLKAAIHIIRTQTCRIYYCILTSSDDTIHGILVNSGSNAYVEKCTISDHNYAIFSRYMSTVCSDNNDGLNNKIGLVSYLSSTIGKLGTQPSGDIAEWTYGGGEIR
jgi:Na+-transporting methylmalonyl-CoA/oxaloacetate decarboxylase gamma subunit